MSKKSRKLWNSVRSRSVLFRASLRHVPVLHCRTTSCGTFLKAALQCSDVIDVSSSPWGVRRSLNMSQVWRRVSASFCSPTASPSATLCKPWITPCAALRTTSGSRSDGQTTLTIRGKAAGRQQKLAAPASAVDSGPVGDWYRQSRCPPGLVYHSVIWMPLIHL